MGWKRFFHRRLWDEERACELQAYLEIETEENIARGMPPEEAPQQFLAEPRVSPRLAISRCKNPAARSLVSITR